MIALVAAEFIKIRTTRIWLGMLGLGLWFVLLSAGTYAALAGVRMDGEVAIPPVSEPATVRAIYGSASNGLLFVLILGILGFSGEFRHRTIDHTFLVTPRRGRVLAAKLASYFLFGLAWGAVVVAFTAAVAVPALALRGGPVSPAGDGVPAILCGTVLAMGLYALIGLGLGALIRNQVAAILVGIGWMQLLEGVIGLASPEAGRWLPGGAVRSITRMSVQFGGFENPPNLPAWGGVLLLLAYGTVFSALAAATTMRRDVR